MCTNLGEYGKHLQSNDLVCALIMVNMEYTFTLCTDYDEFSMHLHSNYEHVH